MKKLKLILLLSSLLGFAQAQNYQAEKIKDNDWSRFKTPTKDSPSPIGSYSNGCLLGGQALPSSGVGYVDMRRQRQRFYGMPELIGFITRLGAFIDKQHQQKILVGDLSQPRGGRMNFGHASHQIGLDVDIWLQTVPKNAVVKANRDMQTIVDKASGQLNQHLPQSIRDALYFSATYSGTSRIFVNPVIKWQLCQQETNTAWLHKIRPWWGHDEHFHVRLTCPENATDCQNQAPIPAGDGCDDALFAWVQEQSDLVTGRKKPAKKKGSSKPKPLPAACAALLHDG